MPCPALLVLGFLLAGLFPSAAFPKDPLGVFVSIVPQACFVERVGGQHVRVDVLVGPGKSHHTYEPTPRQLSGLARADVCFLIGVPFERTLATKIAFTLEGLRLVHTEEGVSLRTMSDSSGRGAPDPHIWMDPKLVKIQAATIAKELSNLDPEYSVEFEKNLSAFQTDLDRLDDEIRGRLAPFKGRDVYVYHPAFGYFLGAYGLNQKPVEVDGKEPGSRQLASLIDQMKREKVKVLFVQPQFSPKTAQGLANAVGLEVVTLDPLEKDYFHNLQEIAEKIVKALE